MSKRLNFREFSPNLSEEHVKQICRFTGIPYVEGEWQRWRAYAEFKKWHHDKLKERDELVRKIRAIKKRSRLYAPIQSVVDEYVSLKEKIGNLESGEKYEGR